MSTRIGTPMQAIAFALFMDDPIDCIDFLVAYKDGTVDDTHWGFSDYCKEHPDNDADNLNKGDS